jgi:hypothetical protein
MLENHLTDLKLITRPEKEKIAAANEEKLHPDEKCLNLTSSQEACWETLARNHRA